MRRILLPGLLVVLLAGPASSQDVGIVGVYADQTASGCLVQDAPGVVQAYVVHTGATEANASQFKLAIDPAVQLNLLAATVNPSLISLGDLFQGIVITYIGCKTTFPLTLATLTFLGDGSTTTCGAIRVVPDPDLASGQIEVVDCSSNIRYARNANAWVNDAGDCDCIFAARVSVETSAPGLDVTVDSQTHISPRGFYWDSGTSHTISTTSPQGPVDTKYKFVSWSDGGAQTHTFDVGDQDSTLTALFELEPRNRLASVPTGLVVTVNGVPHITPYDAYWVPGSSHTIRAITPQGSDDSVLTFLSWSDGKAAMHSVVAADHDTTFTAYFGFPPRFEIDTDPSGLDIVVDGIPRVAPYAALWVPASVHSIEAVSPQPQGADTLWVFDSWSDGGARAHNVVAGTEDSTIVATFSVAPTVSFETIPPGLDVEVDATMRTTPYSESWVPGASHTIAAINLQGGDTLYVFDSWSDGGTLSHSVSTGFNDTTFTATYEIAPQVTIDTDPPGLIVEVDSVVHTAPFTESWIPGASHPIAAVSPQGVSPVYVFSAWSDGGALSHPVSTGFNDTTFTATYEIAPRVTIDTDPTGLDVIVDSVVHTAPFDDHWLTGANHQIAVVSPQGTGPVYVFSSWSDGGALSHTASVGANDTTFTATFVGGITATIDTDPTGLNVLVDSGLHTAPYDAFWLAGSSHEIGTLTTQGIDPVYAFDSWSDGGAKTHTVVGNDDTTFTATFVRLTRVRVNTQPQGVEVTVDSLVYISPHDFHWLPGSSHTLSVPDSIEDGYLWLYFGGWSDIGGEPQRVFVTPDVDSVLTAYFGAVTGAGNSPVPSDVVLRPNTPNPFNPTTRIEFSVPAPQIVEVLIFDVSGRMIRRLHAGNVPYGVTTLTWDGMDDGGKRVGSGVYFYQLRTPDKRITRKMVLLK